MTSLTILPNTDKKTLKLTGKVAAGEHVAVSVSGGADWIGEGKALRLRVIFGMKQVAMFPLVTEEDAAADTSGETVADAWAAGGEGDADATCTLNLFTIPAEKYLKYGGNCLWVLDDIENKTLYGTGETEVLPWPKRRGSDVPYALDEYPDIVAEMQEAWVAYQATVNAALASHEAAVAAAIATKADATALATETSNRESGDAALGTRVSAVEATTATHTSQISSLQTDVASKADATATSAALLALDSGKADKATTLAGYGITDAKISNGVITLGGNSITPLTAHQDITGKADLVDGKVPASQLPSYVDDVLEFPATTDFPAEGEAGKIYVATSTGKVYRWSGSQYIEIANPDLTGYKPKQAAVSDPTASGTAVSFIDTISQNANGVIAPTKKTVATVVASSSGVGGSAGLMTATDKEKLNGVAAGAEVNVIETVKVNGTALTPSSKVVNITVPTGSAASKDVPTFGDASTTQVVMGNDSRLSDARTPTAHKSSHATGGSDAIAPSDIGAAASSHTHSASDITSGLAAVATSGSYSDLSGNPTNVSAFTNDAGYLTAHQSWNDVKPSGGITASDLAAAVQTSLGKADTALQTHQDITGKADASSLAPAFSSDSTVQYAVGSHCTYDGKLYKCTTATTGGTWVAASWEADVMDDPDAVLDITVQNQLRVVAKDGTLLWAQGYDLASTSSATLACDVVNNFTFTDGATSQAFALPAAPAGKVGDFVLDIDNSANTGAATMTFTGLDTAFSVVVPKGKSLNDMLAIAAGELARFYITLSTFRVNNLPTWHIAKQVVENGGATA